MLYLFVGRYLLPLNVFYTADKCSSLCIHTACYLNGSYAIFTRPNTPQPLNSPPPNHICYVCMCTNGKQNTKTKRRTQFSQQYYVWRCLLTSLWFHYPSFDHTILRFKFNNNKNKQKNETRTKLRTKPNKQLTETLKLCNVTVLDVG